ncbi:MAG: hypothetical protein A4E62_03202 [Syntrophorhabdus sp. PtaU1.Bin002]|nr:MAG: hypothetical protein A4E62_03202 [Syntrophorhabdus sp. PtaU1.Bin002]
MSWSEILPVELSIDDYFDPFYPVLFFHWMGDAADLYLDAVLRLFDHRNVFLKGCVNRILCDQLHWLVAAHQLSFACMKDLDDVPAYLTLVNFHSFRHANLLVLSFYVHLSLV